MLYLRCRIRPYLYSWQHLPSYRYGYEPFRYHPEADSSHKQEGYGLGLAMVAQILKLEGGTIAVENIPAGGCRFTVTLQNKNH